jgi:hypothetical protein
VCEGPLTLILFVFCLLGILELWQCDARRRNWERGTGNAGEHWDDNRVITSEFFPDFLYGGACEAGDVFDHFLMVLFEVGADGVVGHGETVGWK